LNIIYDYHLINLNDKKENFPGIDLGDKKNSVSYQVTAEKTSKKVNHTLQEFIDNQNYIVYSRLKILILGKKQTSYTIEVDTSKFFVFDIENDIIDMDYILKEIKNLDLKKKSELNKLIQDELPYGDMPPKNGSNYYIRILGG
jgi:hypothetical protein